MSKFDDEVMETLSTVRSVGLSKSIRNRIIYALKQEDLSWSALMRASDADLLQAYASYNGWDRALNLFEADVYA